MDTHALLMQLLQTLIELGIGVLVPVCVKFVMTKMKTDQLVQSKAYAAIAVAAVEQTMGTADAQAKKAAAIQKLADLTKGALKPNDIDHLIEDAVFTLNKQIGSSVAQVKAAQEQAPAKNPIGFASQQPAAAAPEATPAEPSAPAAAPVTPEAPAVQK